MLEALSLTFVLLIAGASARAWVLPFAKALDKRVKEWTWPRAKWSPLTLVINAPDQYVGRCHDKAHRKVIEAISNVQRAEANLRTFYEAEQRLNEARRTALHAYQ